MFKDLDDTSRKLLTLIQKGFPLGKRPFAALAKGIGIREEEALNRIQELKERKLIVEISGIFNATALGYRIVLVAMKVKGEKLDEAAQSISLHPGVGHNYSRDSLYNLWFTLSLPREKDFKEEVASMQKRAGASSSLLLPSLRLFKIGVLIEPGSDGKEARMEGMDSEGVSYISDVDITEEEIRAVRGLQRNLPLVVEPFTSLAKESGMEENPFLSIARRLLEKKIMRRYAAQVPHRSLGFNSNAMVCWNTPPSRVIEAGEKLASSLWVTHCYERQAYEEWPYNIYSMIHGKSKEECQEKARSLSSLVDVKDYILLFSPREYKKARVKYFLE